MMKIDIATITAKWNKKVIALAVLAGLVLLVLMLVPFGIEWALEKRILNKYLEFAEMEDVDFNPFTGNLTVKRVTFKHKEAVVLDAGRLIIDMDWWPLWKKHIQIKRLLLENAFVQVSRGADGTMSIGGVVIPSGKQPDRSSTVRPWQWGMIATDLKNITVTYSDPVLSKEIMVAQAHIEPALGWAPELPSRFSFRILSDDSVVTVQGEVKPFERRPLLEADVKVDNMGLAWLAPVMKNAGIEAFSGFLNGNTQLHAVLRNEKDPGTIKLDGSVTFDRLDAQVGEEKRSVTIRQERLDIKGSFSYDTMHGVTGFAHVTSGGLRVDSVGKRMNIVVVEKLDVKDIKLGGQAMIHAAEARIRGARLYERPHGKSSGSDEPSHIVSLKGMVLENMRMNDARRVDIHKITIKEIVGWLAREDDGTIELLRWFDKDTPRKDKKQQKKAREGFSFSVKETGISPDSGLVIRDPTARPPFTLRFSPFEVHLGHIDSGSPKLVSPLEIKIQIGKYSSMNVSGTIQPFLDETSVNLRGRLESFDINEVAPYAEQKWSYRPKSGHLDADLQWRQEGGVLNGEVILTLHKFEVERVEQEGEDRFAKLFDIPLNTALDTLRKRDGTIQLRVPFEGDMRDPDFRLHDVIRIGVGSAIKEGAVSYFGPLGVELLSGVALPPGTLSLASKLMQLATTLRFQPVLLSPMISEPGGEAVAYLDQVASLLNKRPDVTLVLCGMATEIDLRKLRGVDVSQIRESGEKKEMVEIKLSDEERERLLQLAKQRADTVKDYLVEKGGIVPKRLVLCTPSIEIRGDTPPRVEMGI